MLRDWLARSFFRSVPAENDSVIIAVMGATGTGKSSLINGAGGTPQMKVGHGLDSCTDVVASSISYHPKSRRKVVFLDTPAFDNTRLDDENEAVSRIVKGLDNISRSGQRLTGILYLHRISDNRMPPQPLRQLEMFRRLCGEAELKRVVFLTTMWDAVDAAQAEAREQELRTKYWGVALTKAQLARHYNTSQSTWDAVDLLLKG